MKAPRAVETLVVVNALIFGFQTLVGPAADAEIIRRFGLSTAGLETGALWQFITHAFLHGNIWHLLFNMLSLWFAGRIVEQTIGTRHFVLLYILSALGGGLGQILLGPENSQLIGASGAVFGVLVAFSTMYADSVVTLLLFFVLPIRLKAKFLGLGLVAVSLISLVTRFEPWIGHAAHLGGAITGYFFARASGFGTPTFPEKLLFKKRGPRRV